MITKLIEKVKSLTTTKKAKNTVQIFPDDTFLVSYPKSGNTWLRFIIANLLKKDENTVIDFHNATDYVPEIGVHNNSLRTLERPRIVKSHHQFEKDYPQVIYCVRDARDVYCSYYNYLRKKLPENTTFSQFLRKSDLYPCRWHTHVESWLGRESVKLIIRYEDLLENPTQEIQKINQLLWQGRLTTQQIEQAISNSSFENMKKLEEEKGRPFKSEEDKQKSTPFVRKGQAGQWKQYFSDDDEAFLMSEAGATLKKLNYI